MTSCDQISPFYHRANQSKKFLNSVTKFLNSVTKFLNSVTKFLNAVTETATNPINIRKLSLLIY